MADDVTATGGSPFDRLLAALEHDDASAWRLTDRTDRLATDGPPPVTLTLRVPADAVSFDALTPDYRVELAWPGAWRGSLMSGSVARGRVDFWARLTDRGASPFGHLTMTDRQVRQLVPAVLHGQLDALLSDYASWWEARALQAADTARRVRTGQPRRPYTCSVPDDDVRGAYRSPCGRLTVAPAAKAPAGVLDGVFEQPPHGSWVVLATRHGRARLAGEYPYWYGSRRAADDRAARLLERPA